MLHDLVHQDGILRIAAAEFEGIAGRHHRAAIIDGGLNGEFLALLILIGPLRADFFNNAAEFMTDDRRMLRNIIGNALMIGALDGRLVAGHADGVRNDLYQNLVVLNGGHFESIQTKIVGAVHAHCFVQHS